MPLNLTDYSQLPVQKPWTDTLFEDALKGYETGRAPKKLKEEQKQRELANALKQQELENNPAKMDLEKRYKEALINKANTLAQGGGKSSLKPNSAVANQEYIWNLKHPNGDVTPEEKEEHLKKLEAAFSTGQEASQSNSNRRKQIINSEFFNKQPAAFKTQQLALAAGMGIDPGEAGKAFENEGKTVSDLAKERGIDPKTIVPVYPMANENIKQLQIRSSLVSELGQLDKDLSDIQGEYSRKFLGYSPKQVWNALKDKDPEEAGMILAARNLQPDLAIVRAKIGINGAIGIQALEEMQNKGLGNMKIFEPLVSNKARIAMDKYTNELITRAFNAYENKMQSYSQIQAQPGQQTDPGTIPNQMMSNAITQKQPGAPVVAPTIPNWVNSSEQFKAWKKTLTPAEQAALRAQHLGE